MWEFVEQLTWMQVLDQVKQHWQEMAIVVLLLAYKFKRGKGVDPSTATVGNAFSFGREVVRLMHSHPEDWEVKQGYWEHKNGQKLVIKEGLFWDGVDVVNPNSIHLTRSEQKEILQEMKHLLIAKMEGKTSTFTLNGGKEVGGWTAERYKKLLDFLDECRQTPCTSQQPTPKK